MHLVFCGPDAPGTFYHPCSFGTLCSAAKNKNRSAYLFKSKLDMYGIDHFEIAFKRQCEIIQLAVASDEIIRTFYHIIDEPSVRLKAILHHGFFVPEEFEDGGSCRANHIEETIILLYQRDNLLPFGG
jgi:hypothetical protein